MSDSPPFDPPEFHPAEAYRPALPEHPRPIVLVGAGGIVRDAHLPAYRKADFPVWGIADIDIARARTLADEYGIDRVFGSAAEAIAAAPAEVVYDVALMPEHFPATLEQLPDGAAVLVQKPLGQTLADGIALRELCARKGLMAAVNTQLRFAPYVAAARQLIADGVIGELYDLEIRVQTDTPWHMFPSVFGLPRLEINMHSVHYIDLVRSFLGDPSSVSAVTVRHPEKPEIANTRSTILMRYRDRPIRVTISVNHDHAFGSGYDESFIKWEGTRGAIRAQMGLLLDYPTGGPDKLELALLAERERGWVPVPFEGSWFPDAFIGSMGAVQRFVEGSVPSLPTSVDDVLHTMAAVEAAYESEAREGVPIDITGETA
ncbi:Gfo/Idh/MocA family protein [Homoserinibacter gongjuensis]|uniref:Oxidoreductase n=1 Tax=Homoserinibacter gongjuensis TaxID=1162968 RepID=A0ABQ6JTR1_9MICO|nr:Gfo/Idh/MocA family oxidoreductase [Homoserinibacter gongjuensis]GMA91553.1 oxidoreductase [Homoserinibacter gongjuensis]